MTKPLIFTYNSAQQQWLTRLCTLLIYIMCAIGVSAQERYADHSLLSSGKWVKVKVANEGVYQLTKSDLTKLGFSNPSAVRLYGYNVPMLPESEIESFDDDLTEMPVLRKSDGTMLFYSYGTTEWQMKKQGSGSNSTTLFTHRNNPYSNYVCYFLTEQSSSAPAALEKSEVTTASKSISTFMSHALVEKDEYSFINAGRTFFESYTFSAESPSRNYTLSLPDIASSDVKLTVQFCTASKSSSTLNVTADGNNLTSLTFSALKDYEYGDVRSKTVTWQNVVSGNPSLRLALTTKSGGQGHLDYIRATYERKLNIGDDNYLAFNTEEQSNYTATITGTNANTRVLRVTNPFCTIEQTGQFSDNKYTAVLTPSGEGVDTYVAINTDASFPSPESMGRVANQDLHSLDSVDFVIITPSNGILNDEATRLAKAHAAIDGMRCSVVQADWIYNEFSSGTPDITAYRRFLKMLFDKSNGAGPRNVLLFGRGVWDNRMVTNTMRGQKQEDYLLCYESDNSVSHTNSYIAEEYITLLKDGKGVEKLKESPDCGVGRLPVASAAEARTMVDKAIRYMTGIDHGAWLNTICILADDGNGNLHGEDAESVWASTSKEHPGYLYKKIYWDAYDAVKTSTGTTFPETYAEINKQMDSGALIMNYTGHGAAYCLSHEQVLKTADFQNWTSPRLPLWITAGCDIMPMDMNTTNIGVEAVLNPSGGAIGFVGTTRTVYSKQNAVLNKYFMKRVIGTKENGQQHTIGEALAGAKADIIDNTIYWSAHDSINKVHFVLIGDPAITLPTPSMKVCVDKINGADALSQERLTISAGQTITIEGHVESDEGEIATSFDGIISPTMLDCIETIVCKDNDGSVSDAGKKPLEYQDRRRVLFTGTDSIRGGQFAVTFAVPLDISYANESGLIALYAIDNTKSLRAQGAYSQFNLGGTSTDALSDTIGPLIAAYLDSPHFVQGGKTGTTPTLYAELTDSSGINSSSSTFAREMTAIIDNAEATTYSLRNYYRQSIGDYRSGTITFTVPELPAGKHTLTLRAFDTFNNMSEFTLAFEVVEGMTQVVEYFDMAGRKMTDGDMPGVLQKGVYIRRIRQVAPEGTVGEETQKILIAQ